MLRLGATGLIVVVAMLAVPTSAAVLVSGSYSQDFDTFEGTEATLPSGWTHEFTSGEEGWNDFITRSTADPTPFRSGTRPRGVWAARDNEGSTDYWPAITYASNRRGDNFDLTVQNNDSSAWTKIDVSFVYTQISDANRGETGSFTYSLDGGGSFLPVAGIADHSTPDAGVTFDFRDDTLVTNRNGAIEGLSVAPGDQVILRWNLATGSGSGHAEMLGFDDVQLTFTAEPATAIPEPATILAIIAAGGALGGYIRRRRS
jgi:hypothetical protein